VFYKGKSLFSCFSTKPLVKIFVRDGKKKSSLNRFVMEFSIREQKALFGIKLHQFIDVSAWLYLLVVFKIYIKKQMNKPNPCITL